jgi:Trypsin-co-occurring domain 1
VPQKKLPLKRLGLKEIAVSSPTIPVIVTRAGGASDTKGIASRVAERVRDTVDINADLLKENLSALVDKLGKVVAAAEWNAGGLALTEVEVGVEITAEGGVALIGTASVGATASITLTFQRKE